MFMCVLLSIYVSVFVLVCVFEGVFVLCNWLRLCIYIKRYVYR